MRKLVCPRFPQFQACVSPLGQLHSRPLFGGYSLAIDDTVFAMVAEGDIYLRACEQSAAYRVEHRNPLLTLRRHGRIVPMKYYQIDDALWRDETQLFRLSLLSWQSAQREKNHRRASGRLKDLPNISFHMELQLIHAGIPDVRTLREVGAQQAWQRLRENNASLSSCWRWRGRLSAFTPPRSRRCGVRSCSNGLEPASGQPPLFCLSVNALLQAANFRQQREQQANLL